MGEARTREPVALDADLSSHAGQAIRIELAAGGDAGAPVALMDPRIVLPGVAATPALPARRAKNVVLWLVDTLRPDRLRAYNPKTRVESPAVEQMAREGVLFESCVAQGNESISSHATLFSGQYPVVHKLTTPKRKLAKKLTTLPEAFRKQGVRTGAFISNGYVSKRWGFGEGWDAYRNFIRESLPSHAGRVWKDGHAFIEKSNGDRFFAYLGTIDPHVAYNAPKPYRLMYRTKPYKGRLKPRATGVFLDKWKANGRKPELSKDDQDFLVALYDGEITYNDHVLGQVLDYLVQSGRADDTVVVYTSDHGEEFFEHGTVGHGHTVRQVLTHVPLLVWWPGALPGGRRVAADVELLDIMPTVLDLVGAPTPATVQGESLVPHLVDAAPALPRPAFSFHGGVRSAKLGRFKYVLLSRAERVYDLPKDPFERKDVAASHPLALRLLREAMTLHRAANERWHKAEHGHVTSPTAAGASLLLAE